MVGLVFSSLLVLPGCAAADAPHAEPTPQARREATVAEVSSAATASASPAASAAPAEEAARKALESIHGEGIDALQAGRMATFELGKDVYDLPKSAKKIFNTVTGEGIDPSQKSRLVGFLLMEEPFNGIVKKLCGAEFKALQPELEKVKYTERSSRLVSKCKLTIQPDAAKLPKLDAWGLLTANAVADLLAARAASRSELDLAELMVQGFLAWDPDAPPTF